MDHEKQLRTIFIGNIHNTIGEHALYQIFEKYGEIETINYKWHIAGPLKGKPKGFSLITFKEQTSRETAIRAMNDRRVQGQKMRVKPYEPSETTAAKNGIVANTRSLTGTTDDKIKALEEKLASMKKNDPDFKDAKRVLLLQPPKKLSVKESAQVLKADEFIIVTRTCDQDESEEKVENGIVCKKVDFKAKNSRNEESRFQPY